MNAEAAGGCRYRCLATPRTSDQRAQHDAFAALFDELDFEALNVVLDQVIASTAGDADCDGLPPVFDLDTFVGEHNWTDPFGALRFAKGLAELFERGRTTGERHPMPAPPPPRPSIVAVLAAEPHEHVVFADDESRPWKVRAWAVDTTGDCWPILPPHPDDGTGPGAIVERHTWWPVQAPDGSV